MLATMLGFGGRMGRLRFLLWSLGLGAALGTLTLLLVLSTVSSAGAKREAISFGWIVLVVGPLYAWGTIALLARRFRDIGWSPLYVILGWMAFWCLDTLATSAFPVVAAGGSGHSYLYLIGDLLLIAALLLWPGTEPDAPEIDMEAIRRAYRDGSAVTHAPDPPKKHRAAPTGRTGFGRRIV